jgi:hypothetical protein
MYILNNQAEKLNTQYKYFDLISNSLKNYHTNTCGNCPSASGTNNIFPYSRGLTFITTIFLPKLS